LAQQPLIAEMLVIFVHSVLILEWPSKLHIQHQQNMEM